MLKKVRPRAAACRVKMRRQAGFCTPKNQPAPRISTQVLDSPNLCICSSRNGRKRPTNSRLDVLPLSGR